MRSRLLGAALFAGLISAVIAQPLPSTNAKKLQGRAVCTDTPSDAQALVWSAASGCWKATTGVAVLISTSGPVADPGGTSVVQFNNAAGALTFNAPAGVAGYQRCYRNATGKSGAITVQMAASNTVDLDGVNGSAAGTLVSGGALGDAVCIVSDATNHWYAYVQKGTWTPGP